MTKLICFTLSMPSNNSWNNRWSGEDNFYAIVKRFPKGKADRVAEEGYYTHNFGDGWVARISAKEVTVTEARSIRKKSKGFCGYEWIVRDFEMYVHEKYKQANRLREAAHAAKGE